MSFKKNHHDKVKERFYNDSKKTKQDVVDRFLRILWKREVDLKLTFK